MNLPGPGIVPLVMSAMSRPVSFVNKSLNRMWHFRLLMRQLGQPRGSSVIPKGLAGDSALLPGSNQQGHGGSWQGLAFDISWVGTVTRNGCHFAPRLRAFRGRAVVVMTRRPAAIAKCDRPMIFQAGRTRAVGPRGDILCTEIQDRAVITRRRWSPVRWRSSRQQRFSAGSAQGGR